ncbi:MAG: LysE family transporter [Deltaproteobacteria bacterium]|nr:LysE family transporter [Deltaproteobacteria bacterium]MCW5803545.1 LysE family transporter [Deltaproteobacteria bacterium]
MLTFLLIGVAAGALTGVPIGPVNVAVIDAAYRYTFRRGIAVGLGGAVADGFYAGLGVLGVTPVLRNYASVPPILYAVSGIVLLVYGFLTARSQPVKPATNPEDDPAASESVAMRREMWAGFRVGLLLIVLNPAAIVTWVVIMGSMIPPTTTWEGLACTLGVVIGSFVWFALVAYLTTKGKSVLGDKAAWIPRVIGVALMLYAVYLLGKAVKFIVA